MPTRDDPSRDSGDLGDAWPGQRLGLPETGPGSITGFGRRVLALLIDWGLAMLISAGFFEGDPIATLILFVAMHIILIGLLGVTIGKRLVRIQVVRGHRVPGPLWAAVRTGLLLLVIPALIPAPDGRCLHDRAAGTMEIRM
ncbi:MAG: RDD family protein [Nesterenkonia sp.]|uniref:RDD family protein n=1 Tax=Nesterenkonia marinintestina TaxID=2979865 RepID=UPI0021C14BCC|nr:RDD family protein [Nesterenkonia sp. GX14115]MDO5493382.1 RDD family protein [Nesterenkonia sp.]